MKPLAARFPHARFLHPHGRRWTGPRLGLLALAAALLWPAQPALADFVQQGPKLVGTGATGAAQQGTSVAVSADGSTAIVGGRLDNGHAGAAWVFTRSGGVWTQQGAKLVGTGGSFAEQGFSVALSSDGNTAIVGGRLDNGNIGAAWVFTRSGGVWTQQGTKLIGTGAVGGADQGTSVALSADGNTAIVGGPTDNSGAGAAWVFTRSGGVWTQQGAKLVGTGAVSSTANQGFSVALSADGNTAIVGGVGDGAAWVFTRSGGVWTQQGPKLVGTGGSGSQGRSVALSADGNTAIVGGPTDNSGAGTAWVFTRSGGVWTQQGAKLVGSGAVGGAQQGSSVALSGGGDSAVVGGPFDNGNAGAAWVFTRSGGVWTQQGNKLAGTGATGNAQQGTSVTLSADGNTGVVGGIGDNSSTGAAWVFVMPGAAPRTATHDFNGDWMSDIVWRDSSGNAALWMMSSSTVLSAVGLGNVPTSWSIVGQRDFNGDGFADILWTDGNGNVAIWLMIGSTVQSAVGLGQVPTIWSVVGTGDFNNDGKSDILWHDNGGAVAIWLMNGTTIQSSVVVGSLPPSWSVAGTGDFNGGGMADILWRDTSGNVQIWLMNSTTVTSMTNIGNVPISWTIVGTGDFDGDGKADILWHDTSGNVALWLMNGTTVSSAVGVGQVPTLWTIVGTGDFDGDGKSDILWSETGGNVAVWLMNGSTLLSASVVGQVAGTWQIQGANAD